MKRNTDRAEKAARARKETAARKTGVKTVAVTAVPMPPQKTGAETPAVRAAAPGTAEKITAAVMRVKADSPGTAEKAPAMKPMAITALPETKAAPKQGPARRATAEPVRK